MRRQVWQTDWRTDTAIIGNNNMHLMHSMQPKMVRWISVKFYASSNNKRKLSLFSSCLSFWRLQRLKGWTFFQRRNIPLLVPNGAVSKLSQVFRHILTHSTSHATNEMLTSLLRSMILASVSLSVTRAAVQTRLNGSRSCLEWRLLEHCIRRKSRLPHRFDTAFAKLLWLIVSIIAAWTVKATTKKRALLQNIQYSSCSYRPNVIERYIKKISRE